MPLKITLFLGLLFGMLIGIGLLLWVKSQSQSVLLSPLSTSPVPERGSHASSLQTKADKGHFQISSSPQTVLAWFSHFEQEQQQWLPVQSKVLGTSTAKGTYTIALFGDSMIDTLGTDVPALQPVLKAYYPEAQFTLLNYGIGAQSIASAAQRIHSAYNYKDRAYPPLTQVDADLIIIESFAYNPIEEQEYQSQLVSVITSAQSTGKPVLFLATIAPLKSSFGKGPLGVNWEADVAWQHASTIGHLLERSIATAKSLGIPVIDVYHASLQKDGEGVPVFVSTGDGIHPSQAGQEFISKLIAQKMVAISLW